MKKILIDFFPVILFFIAYKNFDIYTATAAFMGAVVIQLALDWITTRKIPTLHCVTAIMTLVFGGLTLALEDSAFFLYKPTLLYSGMAIAFVVSIFVGKATLIERALGGELQLPKPVWVKLTYMWVGFFVVSALLNTYVASQFSEETWVDFKLFGMMGLTFGFAILQAVYMSRHLPDENSNNTPDGPNA